MIVRYFLYKTSKKVFANRKGESAFNISDGQTNELINLRTDWWIEGLMVRQTTELTILILIDKLTK